MALYTTKKSFFAVAFFGDNVQKRKKSPFGDFFRGKKADSHFGEVAKNSLLEVRSGFGLS